jgi:hypothetical protein
MVFVPPSRRRITAPSNNQVSCGELISQAGDEPCQIFMFGGAQEEAKMSTTEQLIVKLQDEIGQLPNENEKAIETLQKQVHRLNFKNHKLFQKGLLNKTRATINETPTLRKKLDQEVVDLTCKPSKVRKEGNITAHCCTLAEQS